MKKKKIPTHPGRKNSKFQKNQLKKKKKGIKKKKKKKTSRQLILMDMRQVFYIRSGCSVSNNIIRESVTLYAELPTTVQPIYPPNNLLLNIWLEFRPFVFFSL